MKSFRNGERRPRRDCQKCKGEGFIMGIINGESRVVGKCDCWRFVSFKKSERPAGDDGKSKAAGGE